MRAARRFLPGLLLLTLTTAAFGQEKDLLSIIRELGAGLEWDPLRDRGVISVGDDRISLGVGLPLALINYRTTVAIPAPTRRDGAVWLASEAVTSISRALQQDRIARRAGHLRIAAILIDPGHGGEDPGATGTFTRGGKTYTIREKDVVLKIGLTLAAMLRKALPDKQILLTRSDDHYVTLEKRAEMANNVLGTTKDTVLYISVHANSTLNKLSDAKGYEVWYLPPEYKRTVLQGQDDPELAPILNSMLEEEISVESIVLAREILAGLDASVGSLTEDRGMRQQSWYVVRNAKMPAVLVEVGFMSSPEEAARLADPAYLKGIADGLYSGIRSFITRFEQYGRPGVQDH